MLAIARSVAVLLAAMQTAAELARFRRLPPEARERDALAERFAQRLIRLGPLFVKIGQVLSTRPDFVPREYIRALRCLQERVPAMTLEAACRVICTELRCDRIQRAFRDIEEVPIASASLAQVHLATLADGTPVAVKVQRPEAAPSLARDLRVLGGFVAATSLLAPRLARNFNLRAGFAEFSRYTLAELDFRTEAKTMLEFRQNFADSPDVIIPRPYEDLVTERVLTMESISGERVDAAASHLDGPERLALGRRLMEFEMKMFVGDGLFHADMHPGNIFFTRDGRIVLLDFGMYGRLSRAHRDHFILYWFYASLKNTRGAFRHLIAQTRRLAGADEEAYYRTFEAWAERFYASRIDECSLTQTYLRIIAAGARYGFLFPSELLLHAKALTTAEALMFVLTPELRFEDEVRPIVAAELVKRVLDADRFGRMLREVVPELLLFGRLPEGDGLDGAPGIRQSSGAPEFAAAAVDLLRPAFDASALGVLGLHLPSTAERVLREAWANAEAERPKAPPQSTLGAAIMIRLAGLTMTLFRALARQVPEEEATRLVHDIAWDLYRKTGALVWSLARMLAGNDPAGRLLVATTIFRCFPFSAPSYRWRDVPASNRVVAFDCTRCPVADYFKEHALAELCVRTWCALDFPLARLWNGRLERGSSIAAGATSCDFRWFAENLDPIEEKP